MNESTTHYFLKEVVIQSSLTAMEKKLSKCVEKYKNCVLSAKAVQQIISELREMQVAIKAENPRLREVDIRTSSSSVSSCIWLYIGNNAIVLHNILRFIE